MNVPVIILTVSFIIFLLMNVPIAISIGLSTFFTGLYVMGSVNGASDIIAQRIATCFNVILHTYMLIMHEHDYQVKTNRFV